ncbi:MAG: glycerol-3-phosphate 1-O-acyltransferase PlsY [Firmicutes bacterium]|nr:glycerol-3-phosphate 1-O-acyltransferase PlsY [Bacillota bacterium]
MWVAIIWALAAWGLGGLPFGYLWARWRHGVDVRQHGSRNIGATNVARTVGLGAGLLVLALDAAKGYVAVAWVGPWALHHGLPAPFGPLTGTLAVLGHGFSPWLRFRGGKGVATALGATWALSPIAGAVGVAVFLAVALATRWVSLASGMAILAVLASVWLSGRPGLVAEFALPVATFSLWAHRANWARLSQGTEPRFAFPSRTA